MNISRFTIEEVFKKCGGGWRGLLCTTYGIDPEVLHFIVNRYLRSSVDQGAIHVLADARKLDERTVNLDDLNTFSKLVGEISIGSEIKAGAFHPKIFFFASDDKLSLILLTGNITAGGILSGVDLFSYIELSPLNRDIFLGAYTFLKGMKGWNNYAREIMRNIEVKHPWIINESTAPSRFLFSRSDDTLLAQVRNNIKGLTIQKLQIFSPFVSLDIGLFSQLRGGENYPIEVYLGREEVDKQFSIDDFFAENIHFLKGADVLHKWPFHAKIFNFITAEKHIAFWGSANCTLSAFLISEKNSEFLLQEDMDEEVFQNLMFISGSQPIEVVPTKLNLRVKKEDRPVCHYSLVIRHCFMEGNFLKVTFDKIYSIEVYVKIKTLEGNEVSKKIIFDEENISGSIELDGSYHPVFISPSVNDLRCGPWILVLDEDRIFNRSSKPSSHATLTQGIARIDINTLRRVKECLEFIDENSNRASNLSSKSKLNKTSKPINLWIPQRKIGGHYYRNTYAPFPRKRRWENEDDTFTDEETKQNDGNRGPENIISVQEADPINYLSEELDSVIKKVTKAEVDKFVVVKESLANALEHYSQFVLRDFSKNSYNYNLDDMLYCACTFNKIARLICYLYQPITSSNFSDGKDSLDRASTFGAIVYLNARVIQQIHSFKLLTHGSQWKLDQSDDRNISSLREEAVALKAMFDYFNSKLEDDLLPMIRENLDFLEEFLPHFLVRDFLVDDTFNWTKTQVHQRPLKRLDKGDWLLHKTRGLIQCTDPVDCNPKFFNSGFSSKTEAGYFRLGRAYLFSGSIDT